MTNPPTPARSETTDLIDYFGGDDRLPAEQKEHITFEGVRDIDHDTDLWFKLRGHSLNPLVDAATPLFGLILRIQDLNEHNSIDTLYRRVHSDIAAISEEIRQHDYDEPTQLSFRYCLCAFIDETVMATRWGAESVWAERSLLSHYHEETWGGEKVFVILERMLLEPDRYQHMLEFLYLSLALGFRGKYGIIDHGREHLDSLLQKLHRVLREQKGDPVEQLIPPSDNVSHQKNKLKRQLPLWSVWVLLGAVLIGTYSYYATQLSRTTDTVIYELDRILER
ncbi:MAG: type IVB secretion system protein IcmH/DotU [Pseudomonadota bacterium]